MGFWSKIQPKTKEPKQDQILAFLFSFLKEPTIKAEIKKASKEYYTLTGIQKSNAFYKISAHMITEILKDKSYTKESLNKLLSSEFNNIPLNIIFLFEEEATQLLSIYTEYVNLIIYLYTRKFGFTKTLNSILTEAEFKDSISIDHKLNSSHLEKNLNIDKKNKEERNEYIKTIFKNLLTRLANHLKENIGNTTTNNIFEESYKEIKNKFVAINTFSELLVIIPNGILETEKLTTLTKEELSKMIYDRTKELDNMKKSLEEKVEQRTKDLQIEKNKLKTILDSINDGVIGVDNEKKILTVSHETQNIFNLDFSNLIGKDINECIQIYQKDETKLTSQVYCPSHITKTSETYIYQNAEVYIMRNGEKIYLELKTTLLHDNEKPIGYVITLKNINEKLNLEEMKLDFVSMAAHELRTPLTAIKGYLSLILEDKDRSKKIDSKNLYFIQKCFSNSQILTSLIENLLNVSKIEKGKLNLELDIINWCDYINSVVEDYKGRANDREIQLEFLRPNEDVYVKVDKLSIYEVIGNLLSNAINYTPQKGMVLVEIKADAKEVITNVKDTGEGISTNAQKDLFTKFYRVHSTLGEGSKGTGLGLYIAKSITELHNGTIGIDSDTGKGSNFYFKLKREYKDESK